MIEKKTYPMPDGTELVGYRLGHVDIADTAGDRGLLVAYFCAEPAHLVIVEEVTGSMSEYHDEESFLRKFGTLLAYRLVWLPQQADLVPEIKDWFPEYETWAG
jgi:hypothetical protein